MKLIGNIIDYLKAKETGEGPKAPEGLCPNCWGTQEYEGKFYHAIKNQKVDVNSSSEFLGWVQDYANKHLLGIQIKTQAEEKACEKCKLSYQESS